MNQYNAKHSKGIEILNKHKSRENQIDRDFKMNESISQNKLMSNSTYSNSSSKNGSRFSRKLLNDLDIGNDINMNVNDVHLNSHKNNNNFNMNNNRNNNYGKENMNDN